MCCPGQELRRHVNVSIEVVCALVPDKTVHLEGIGRPLVHDGFEDVTINCVSSECDISMPRCRSRRLVVCFLKPITNVQFLDGFKVMRYKFRKINPFIDVEIKDRIVGWNVGGNELVGDGIGAPSHGRFLQRQHVKGLRKRRETDRTWLQKLEL